MANLQFAKEQVQNGLVTALQLLCNNAIAYKTQVTISGHVTFTVDSQNSFKVPLNHKITKSTSQLEEQLDNSIDITKAEESSDHDTSGASFTAALNLWSEKAPVESEHVESGVHVQVKTEPPLNSSSNEELFSSNVNQLTQDEGWHKTDQGDSLRPIVPIYEGGYHK